MGADSDFEAACEALRLAARRAASRYVGSDEAEDVAAEAVAKAWLHWHLLDAAAGKPWIVRVATNLAIDALRRRRPTAEVVELHTRGFEDAVVTRDAVATAIGGLPERQREAIVLRHLAGMSQLEVAAALGIARATAAVHISRGEATLRSHLSTTEQGADHHMTITTIDDAVTAMADGTIIRGRITGATHHALTVDIGLPATMAARHIDLEPVDDLGAWVGRDIDCVVRGVAAEPGLVFVSRLHAVETADHRDRRRAWFTALQPGDTLPGVVTSTVDFGWFVDLENGTGLVHRSVVTTPLTMGDRILVEVLAVDPAAERISLRPTASTTGAPST